MLIRHSDGGYSTMSEGVEIKTVAHGEKTLMVKFKLGVGGVIPLHAHPHEQTGHLFSGRIRLQIGDEVLEVSSGDSWSIPGNTQHKAEVLEPSIAVEVFSPLREEYLAYAPAAD